MADVEKEVVVTNAQASRGATALAAVIALVLLLIVLAYFFGGELFGGADTADVKVDVRPS